MDGDRLLAEFLRARRHATSLERVGLPRSGRRRTPGLRREEVAMLAGVSTDYYVRLEQGRERHPSDQVLVALAQAFDLDAEGTEFLLGLVHRRARKPAPTGRTKVDPYVMRLISAWDRTPTLVVSRWLDILGANPLAAAVLEDVHHGDNLVRSVVLDPESRVFYRDWKRELRANVAHLRAEAGADGNDPFLIELVEELSLASEEFRELWARHDVRSKPHEFKYLHHRYLGDLDLWRERLSVESAPGQYLFIYQAEPGSPTESALDRVRSRIAGGE